VGDLETVSLYVFGAVEGIRGMTASQGDRDMVVKKRELNKLEIERERDGGQAGV